MKKIILCAVTFLSIALFTTSSAQSADSGDQPRWAAGKGNAEYLYMPEIDAYYYMPRKQFIYQSGNTWTFSSVLPAQMRKVDLNSTNKVVINQAGAYRYNAEHKIKYSSGGAKLSNADKTTSSVKKQRNRDKDRG